MTGRFLGKYKERRPQGEQATGRPQGEETTGRPQREETTGRPQGEHTTGRDHWDTAGKGHEQYHRKRHHTCTPRG